MYSQIEGSLSGFEADNGDGFVNEGILLFLILAITGVALLLLLVLALLLVLVVASVLPPFSLLANSSSSE